MNGEFTKTNVLSIERMNILISNYYHHWKRVNTMEIFP